MYILDVFQSFLENRSRLSPSLTLRICIPVHRQCLCTSPRLRDPYLPPHHDSELLVQRQVVLHTFLPRKPPAPLVPHLPTDHLRHLRLHRPRLARGIDAEPRLQQQPAPSHLHIFRSPRRDRAHHIHPRTTTPKVASSIVSTIGRRRRRCRGYATTSTSTSTSSILDRSRCCCCCAR